MFIVLGESDIYVTLTRTMTHKYKSFYIRIARNEESTTK